MTAAGKLVEWHIRLVYRTSKEFRSPADSDGHIKALSPGILTMWHGQFLLVPCFKPKGLPVSVMVARHADGEMIARAIDAFDMKLIRGAGAGDSGKDRGGMEALRAAVQALREGTTIAMTTDVPPGPARTAGLGIVMIARISGRPIIPVATATKRLVTFPTWSRFTLNLPFSKVAGVVGDPIYVPRNADGAELERCRQQVEDAVNEVTERAYRLVGSSVQRIVPPDLQPPRRKGFLLSLYRGLTSAARPLAPFILSRRARRGKEIAARLDERLGRSSIPRPDGPLFWFHAASVGETNAILPLIAELKRRYGSITMLLTTITVTAAKIAEDRLPPGAIHQFVPLDNPVFARRFLDHWQPDTGIFIESEIWPNLIVEAEQRGVSLILVNGRMSQKSAKRWARFSSIGKPVFSRFDLALAQTWRISKRLKNAGVRNTVITGNLKYDAPPPPVNAAALSALREMVGPRFVFLAASTHPGEEAAVIEAHRALTAQIPGLLTVIAPRHPARSEEISRLLSDTGILFARRSQNDDIEAGTGVYLADTIGELGLLYSLAPVAFVGGSLIPRGGQNPIEPVKLGCAVISGPGTYNFAETYDVLHRHNACRTVNNSAELAAAVLALANGEQERRDMVKRASSAIAGLGGALEKTLLALEPYAVRALEKHGVKAAGEAALNVREDHAA